MKKGDEKNSCAAIAAEAAHALQPADAGIFDADDGDEKGGLDGHEDRYDLY